MSPSLPINPGIVEVKTRLTSKIGRLFLANSITLTPGTVSLRIDKDTIEVHALSEELAADLAKGTMDRMTTWFEGRA